MFNSSHIRHSTSNNTHSSTEPLKNKPHPSQKTHKTKLNSKINKFKNHQKIVEETRSLKKIEEEVTKEEYINEDEGLFKPFSKKKYT